MPRKTRFNSMVVPDDDGDETDAPQMTTFVGELAPPPGVKPRFTTFDDRSFPMDTKSLFASRTVWFNVLSGAATAIAAIQGMLPASALPYVALATAVINIGLRWITTQPVSVNPQ